MSFYTEAIAASAAAFALGQACAFLSLLLALRRDRNLHRWLIITILAASLSSVGDFTQHVGLSDLHRWLEPLASAAMLAIGPGLWIYTCSLTSMRSYQATASTLSLLHWLPFALLLIFLLWDTSQGANVFISPQRTLGELISLSPVVLHISIYLGMVANHVYRLRPQVLKSFSNVTDRTLSWLLFLVVLFAILILIWVGTWWSERTLSDFWSNLMIACAISLMGIFGARQRNIFVRQDAIPPAKPNPTPVDEPINPEIETSVEAKYQKALLSSQHVKHIATRLQEIMSTDKPYLETDLTLAELAASIPTSSHQLSQYFSQHTQQNFYDYINGLRVDAVKATLARPQMADRPLLEIALECGFGSKSSFNSVFRRITGMTPGEYRRALHSKGRSDNNQE